MAKLFISKVKDLAIAGFTGIGLMWTFIEIMEKYFANLPIVKENKDNLLVLLIPALFLVLYRLVYILLIESKVKCEIRDLKIIVRVGDILKCKRGVIVIGVNNQLNTDEDKIAKNSLHSKMIGKYGQDKMKEVFSKGKKKVNNDIRYFQDEINGKSYLFLAMSDINDFGAVSTKGSTVRIALDSLFFNQENLIALNNNIFIPLIGTGAGGLQPSKQEVIKMIIESFLIFQKDSDEEVSSKIKSINIVVYWKDVFQIDWIELRQWLKNQKTYCLNCKGFGAKF